MDFLLFPTLKKKPIPTSVLKQKSVSFQEIDGYIMQASDKGYSAVISLGSKGLSYATNVVLSTAIKVNNLSTVVMKRARACRHIDNVNAKHISAKKKKKKLITCVALQMSVQFDNLFLKN